MTVSRCFVLIGIVCHVIGALSGSERIVGGRDAAIGEFPYQVSLQVADDGQHICGGTIIKSNWILTAAHCVTVGNGIEHYPVRNFQIRAGSIQRLGGGQLSQLKQIIVHKDYNKQLNDIALLQLVAPLTLNDNTQVIELASNEVAAGEKVVVTGWGRLNMNGPVPSRLQVTELSVLSKSDCEAQIYIGDDRLICLRHDNANGICQGDSGGPAVHDSKLVGIGAFVVGGCALDYPDGYTKVSYYQEWINENTA